MTFQNKVVNYGAHGLFKQKPDVFLQREKDWKNKLAFALDFVQIILLCVEQ